jgi:hypothetical protein
MRPKGVGHVCRKLKGRHERRLRTRQAGAGSDLVVQRQGYGYHWPGGGQDLDNARARHPQRGVLAIHGSTPDARPRLHRWRWERHLDGTQARQPLSVSLPKPYLPLPRVVHESDRYRLELELLPHPLRDAVLIKYALSGEGVRLYVLLAPHLNGRGANTAMAGEDLSAIGGDAALCLRAHTGFSRTSAGYVGASDGWQDFARNAAMTWTYTRAEDGNVALTGELAAIVVSWRWAFRKRPKEHARWRVRASPMITTKHATSSSRAGRNGEAR